MKEKEMLYCGVSRTAWGYFFLYFNFSLGSINFLPNFIAYALFLSSIRLLKGERRDLGLLEPIAIGLAGYEAIVWLMTCFRIPLQEKTPIIGIVASVLSLYFHFQLVTDLAELAKKYEPADSRTSSMLLTMRTIQTILLTVLALPFWKWYVDQEYTIWIMGALMLLGVLCAIILMAYLFELRHFFKEV